jgi:hypothetical protein
MAIEGRIPVRHEDVFPEPVLLMSVEPVEDFDLMKAARDSGQIDKVSKRPTVDVQERDKATGMRLWAVWIIDMTARPGRHEVRVKIAADVQPVPPNGLRAPAEFEGLEVIPYVDTNRARPRLGIAYRATGFRPARAGSGHRAAGQGAAASGGEEGKAA